MRGLNTQLSRWLLGGAIYLTGWYYEGPALQASQMGAISLCRTQPRDGRYSAAAPSP